MKHDITLKFNLSIKVPAQMVDEVTQRMVDLLNELDGFGGGIIEQENITIDTI